MTATTLLQNMSPSPAMTPVWRVRVRETGETGTVIDVGDDSWVYWVGDDKSCHVSRPDHLETVS